MKNNIKSEITKELMECLINNYTTNNDIKTFCDDTVQPIKKVNSTIIFFENKRLSVIIICL